MRSQSLIIVVVALGIVTAALWWDAVVPEPAARPAPTARAQRVYRWNGRFGSVEVSVETRGPRRDGTSSVRIETTAVPGSNEGAVLALDVSSSMVRRSPLEEPGDRGEPMPDQLVEDLSRSGFMDRATVLAFGDTPRVVNLGEPGWRDSDALRTNLEAGLRAAFQAASASRSGRVVLVTDGLTNAGLTRAEDLAAIVAEARRETGVVTHVVGLGVEAQTDLLEALARAGDGTYRFVRSPGELQAAIGAAWVAHATDARPALDDVTLSIDENDLRLGALAPGQSFQFAVPMLEHPPEIGFETHCGSFGRHFATEVTP